MEDVFPDIIYGVLTFSSFIIMIPGMMPITPYPPSIHVYNASEGFTIEKQEKMMTRKMSQITKAVMSSLLGFTFPLFASFLKQGFKIMASKIIRPRNPGQSRPSFTH